MNTRFSAVGIYALIIVFFACVGLLKQCVTEQDSRLNEKCFEQTKDVKCWGLK